MFLIRNSIIISVFVLFLAVGIHGTSYAENIDHLKYLAEQGDAVAQFQMGLAYDIGQDVPQDYKIAKRWYEKSASQGHTVAQNNLGVMYAVGNGGTQNYQIAKIWYERAASEGFSGAQYNLGLLYANGNGVPQDYVMAHKWLNLAASNGSSEAAGDKVKLERVMLQSQIAEAQRLAREWKPSQHQISGHKLPNNLEPTFDEKQDVAVRPILSPPQSSTRPVQMQTEGGWKDRAISVVGNDKNIENQNHDWAITRGFKYSMYQQYGENWRAYMPLLIITGIITWSIGLLPPIAIRFAFHRRPLTRKWAIGAVVLLYFINLQIFTSLGYGNSMYIPSFLILVVSYFIFRKGHLDDPLDIRGYAHMGVWCAKWAVVWIITALLIISIVEGNDNLDEGISRRGYYSDY